VKQDIVLEIFFIPFKKIRDLKNERAASKWTQRIDPDKFINQDTMVQATVIKYDCPNCLPTDSIYRVDYEFDC